MLFFLLTYLDWRVLGVCPLGLGRVYLAINSIAPASIECRPKSGIVIDVDSTYFK